jgi:hypothetical protein
MFREIWRENNIESKQRRRNTSREKYSKILHEDPIINRIYYYLAILVPPKFSPDTDLNATISKLFYYTKSLVMKFPYLAARTSMLTVIKPIITQNNKAAEK